MILTVIRLISAKKRHSSLMDSNSTNNQLAESCCSSSASTSPLWDVFLSVYGKDTRRNFIANLYFALDQAGILTFRDDPALEKGEEITLGLLKAIKDSKMFVVVISENYARSPWCLNELVEVLSCNRTDNQVVPIFYYVDPSDLRHLKGSFGKALDYHKKRYTVDVINKWKSALVEIAQLSGYHLKKDANENEADTIQEIVTKVTAQALTKLLHVEEYLLGLDSAIEEVYEKISMELNDVRAIGICGMGGIGKTTVAKAFYNKYYHKFHISCFIDNMKLYSQRSNPLLAILEKLLIELLSRKDYKVTNLQSGMRQLKKILCLKKALIVLDDLDQSGYSNFLARFCNLFSAGSRIMITTRDENLLKQLEVDISEVEIYRVKVLGGKDSLKLFSFHAFRKTMPPKNFRELSVKFVNCAGGLPLALKVLGSSLRGRTDVSFWKAKLEKLQVIPENEIHKILQLTYDELGDEMVKSIFLDIAFFFVGKDKNEAVHVFNSCHLFPDEGIPILVDRCLLTINKSNKFEMHNLIQDMGRELGKSKRLLLRGNASEYLQTVEETRKIEGLILDLSMSTKRHFDAKIFRRLPNLRLLEINYGYDIKGSFANSLHELRCIRWPHCPWTRLPTSFHPEKLVSLNMPYSALKTLWKGTMPLVCLKTIDISYSLNLKAIYDFRDSKLVETLLLRGCKSLLKVHQSIGQLDNMGHLDLAECDHLKDLPELIGQLSKLGHLDLRGCVNLKRLPEPIKQLANLGHLDLGFCHNLKRLPEQLGDMKGLKMLDVSYTSIEELPDSIACLKELVELNIYSCMNLDKLPEQFGEMEGLETFTASFSALKELPESFGNLGKLVDLDLNSCSNLTDLPNSISKLKLLRVLHLGDCSKLERLPEQLGSMQSLKLLIASHSAIEELPDSIGLLSSLRVLEIYHCKKLKYLPNSIGNLTSLAKLHILQKDILGINFPDTVKNMNLESLSLRCDIRLLLPIISSLSSLKTLVLHVEDHSLNSTKSFSLSELYNLQELTLVDCTSHGSSFPNLPLSLKILRLQDHTTLEQLADLSNFEKLKEVEIRNCISLQSLPPLPPRLRLLEAYGCTSLQNLPDLSMLKKLETLCFMKCRNLKLVSLKQSSLKVGPEFDFSFKADLPNREIPEWFSFKSSGNALSFDFPTISEDDFVGVAIWVVYKGKVQHENGSVIRVAITNITKGITKNFDIYVPTYIVGEEERSRVECMMGDRISVRSGDRIKLSFLRLLYSYSYDEYHPSGYVEVPGGEAKVEKCGVHVITSQSLTSP